MRTVLVEYEAGAGSPLIVTILGGPKIGTPFGVNVAEDFVELLRDESSGSIETTPE